MEEIKLVALRDLALEHIPRAQQVRKQKHSSQDDYHIALYGTATLTLAAPSTTATEQVAASLLQLATSLMIQWDADSKLNASQANDAARRAISTATELCRLTGTSVPWLTDALKHETPPPPAPAPQAAQPSPNLSSALLPGTVLSTKEAARHLKVKEQTLHKWASTESGPLRPIRSNRRLYWQSDDIIRITTGK